MVLLYIIGTLFSLQLLSMIGLYFALRLKLIDESHLENRVQNG